MVYVILVLGLIMICHSFLMYLRMISKSQTVEALSKLVLLASFMSVLLLITLKVTSSLTVYAYLVGLLDIVFSVYFYIKYNNLKKLENKNRFKRVR